MTANSLTAITAGLIKTMDKYKEEIIRTGTDWIYEISPDLRGKRPKEETLKIARTLFSAYYAVLAAEDYAKLHKTIDQVTAFRSSLEFRVSTIEKGFLALLKVLRRILERENLPADFLFEADDILDNLYETALYELSDKYQAAIEKALKEKIEQLRIAEIGLEKKVEEKTAQLQQRIDELEIFRRLAANREIKMIELKKELNELKKERNLM